MSVGLFPLAIIQSIVLALGQVTLKFGLMKMGLLAGIALFGCLLCLTGSLH